MVPNQELTTHCEQHNTDNLNPECEFCGMYEESMTAKTKEEIRRLRERFATKGFKLAHTADVIGQCAKIIEEACKKNNGLPW